MLRIVVEDDFGPLGCNEQPALAARVADDIDQSVSREVGPDGGLRREAGVDDMLRPGSVDDRGLRTSEAWEACHEGHAEQQPDNEWSEKVGGHGRIPCG